MKITDFGTRGGSFRYAEMLPSFPSCLLMPSIAAWMMLSEAITIGCRDIDIDININ
jgi:hypothetical protein